jgi:hypothetical protein
VTVTLTISWSTARACLAAVLAGVLLALLLPAAPAAAIHQNCGSRYPFGSEENGHPKMEDVAETSRGWSGQRQLYQMDVTLKVLEAPSDTLEKVVELIAAGRELIGQFGEDIHELGIPAEPFHHAIAAPFDITEEAMAAVQRGMYIAVAALQIGITATGYAKQVVGAHVAAENSCGSTLSGDMLDNLWVSLVERNLTSDGPPLATLLTKSENPHTTPNFPLMPQHRKADYPWCPPIAKPADAPIPPPTTGTVTSIPDAGGNCAPTYLTGFLDAGHMGVDTIVDTAIKHATAHGLDVRDAGTCLVTARGLRDKGELKQAYAAYRTAYRKVTSPAPIPGGC